MREMPNRQLWMTGACHWLINKAPAFQYSAVLVADLERRMEMMEKEKGEMPLVV